MITEATEEKLEGAMTFKRVGTYAMQVILYVLAVTLVAARFGMNMTEVRFPLS